MPESILISPPSSARSTTCVIKPLTVDTVEQYQQLVGGHVEAVPFPSGHLFVNEDGKDAGLPANDFATQLCSVFEAGLAESDYIVGNAVLVGPTDAEGELTDVDSLLRLALCPDDETLTWEERPESSNVKRFAHTSVSLRRHGGVTPLVPFLYVEFKSGGTYVYLGVPRDVYDELVNAESIGSAVGKLVRGKYACAKIEPA